MWIKKVTLEIAKWHIGGLFAQYDLSLRNPYLSIKWTDNLSSCFGELSLEKIKIKIKSQ